MSLFWQVKAPGQGAMAWGWQRMRDLESEVARQDSCRADAVVRTVRQNTALRQGPASKVL